MPAVTNDIKEIRVKEIHEIISKIIEEHKVILQHAAELEQVANDAEALMTLDKAMRVYMPGRLDQSQGFKKLQDLHVKLEEQLITHFNSEETQLFAAFQKHGDDKLLDSIRTLLIEHKDIRSRLDQEKKHMADLNTQQLSRHVWEATANDIRAHMTHTRKLLEAHAEIEQELLHMLRKEITEAQKGKSQSNVD